MRQIGITSLLIALVIILALLALANARPIYLVADPNGGINLTYGGSFNVALLPQNMVVDPTDPNILIISTRIRWRND
jgi:hypothetical protein